MKADRPRLVCNEMQCPCDECVTFIIENMNSGASVVGCRSGVAAQRADADHPALSPWQGVTGTESRITASNERSHDERGEINPAEWNHPTLISM